MGVKTDGGTWIRRSQGDPVTSATHEGDHAGARELGNRGGQACALCDLRLSEEPAARAELPTTVVVYRDSQVVGLIEPGVPGVLVAPRWHARELSTVPSQMGAVLAAIRRAATSVRDLYGTSGAMIEPTDEVPGATGHVCYRVLPTTPGQLRPEAAPDLMAEAERLFAALGQRGGPPISPR